MKEREERKRLKLRARETLILSIAQSIFSSSLNYPHPIYYRLKLQGKGIRNIRRPSSVFLPPLDRIAAAAAYLFLCSSSKKKTHIFVQQFFLSLSGLWVNSCVREKKRENSGLHSLLFFFCVYIPIHVRTGGALIIPLPKEKASTHQTVVLYLMI